MSEYFVEVKIFIEGDAFDLVVRDRIITFIFFVEVERLVFGIVDLQNHREKSQIVDVIHAKSGIFKFSKFNHCFSEIAHVQHLANISKNTEEIIHFLYS